MEIVENVRTERFSNIKAGQCFRYKGTYYMRTQGSAHQVAGIPVNSVNMTNGLMTYFEKDDEVILISCKMVVE